MFSAAVKKLGFTQKFQMTRPEQIFLVRGKDTSGKIAWYYILVDLHKRDLFKAREGSPFLKLTDYGHVLYSGYGENPNDDIRHKMEDEYGFYE